MCYELESINANVDSIRFACNNSTNMQWNPRNYNLHVKNLKQGVISP